MEVRDEHDDIARAQLVLERFPPAQKQNAGLGERHDDLLEIRKAVLQPVAAQVGLVGLPRGLLHAASFVLREVVGLDRLDAGDRLLDVARDLVPEGVVLVHVGLEAQRHAPGNGGVDQNGRQDDDGELGVDGDHDDQDRGQREELGPDFLRGRGKDGRDLIGLIDLPADRPRRPAREK